MALRTDVFRLGWRAAQRVGRCHPDDTIVIAGTPRGGTTFLLETLRRADGYKATNEPLMPKYAARHDFLNRTFMEPGERHPVREAYLTNVLSGRMNDARPWTLERGTPAGRLHELATKRRLVVKFCRLNRMLQWFQGRFAVRGIVLMVRHPCAVVASMRDHPGWRRWEPAIPKGSARDLSPLPEAIRERFQPLVQDIETKEDALVVTWCIDTYIPLLHFADHPWILSPYERLVREGEGELERLANALGIVVNERMREALGRPSSSTRTPLGADAEGQLTKWRSVLSERTVDRLISFVDRAGLSAFYSAEPEPDYDALDRLQDPRWRWNASPLRAHASVA